MKLREEISSEGLERPEKEPVALSQRKTGGSPERSIEREQAPQWGVATIEIAVSATIEDADIPYYAAGAFIQKSSTFSAVFSTIFKFRMEYYESLDWLDGDYMYFIVVHSSMFDNCDSILNQFYLLAD